MGRISAQVDQRFNEFQHNDWGLWGFFESEDDPEIAQRAARRPPRRGCASAAGTTWSARWTSPPTTSAACWWTGFERPPQILENWHHPYYGALIEGYGLTKVMDLYKWELQIADREKMLPIMFELADKVEPKYGVKVRPMRKRDFENEVRAFMEVYNAAWENNWGFVPLTEDELKAYAKELKPILDENWAWIAESEDGQVVGAALSIPDYNQVLAKLNGRLLPFGWAKALVARRQDRLRAGVRARREARLAAHGRGRQVLRGALQLGRAGRRRPGARWAGSSRPTRR